MTGKGSKLWLFELVLGSGVSYAASLHKKEDSFSLSFPQLKNEMSSRDSEVMVDMSKNNGGEYRSSKSSSLFATVYNGVHTIVLLVAFSLSVYAAKTVRDFENDTKTTVRFSIGKPSSLSSNEESFSFFRGSGVWHDKRDLEVARSDFQAVSIEGDGTDFVYIFGGKDASGAYLKTALKYDTVNDLYVSMGDMPQARARYAATVMKNDNNQDEIWVLGGISAVTPDGTEYGQDEDELCPMVYNVATNTWRTESGERCLPSVVKDACAATGSNNAIYLMGGYGADYSILNSVYKLNGPLSTAWVKTSDLPDPRGDVTCAALKDKIYLAGGWHDPSGEYKFVSQSALFSLEVSTDVWTSTHSEMKHSRGDFQLVANPSTNSLLAIGGETNTTDNSATQLATHHVEEYFVAHDDWEVRQMIPTARFRFGAAFKNGIFHAFGGHVHGGNEADALTSHEAYYPLDHPDVWVTVTNS